MVYLIWKSQVKTLIGESFSNTDGWESWADWKEYFIKSHTPSSEAQKQYIKAI